MKLAPTDTRGSIGGEESTRGEFARQLRVLHQAAGAPSLRHTAMLVRQRAPHPAGAQHGVATAQRISDWLNGRNVPARFESLIPVVQVWDARARRNAGKPRQPVNIRAWKNLWEAARTAPTPETGTLGERQALARGYNAIDSVLEMVRVSVSLQRPAEVIVLIGNPGAGKTALLRTGVVPRLTTEPTSWDVMITTPDSNLNRSMARILWATAGFGTLLPNAEAHPQSAKVGRLLLIVDQFEQLYHPDVEATSRDAFLLWLKHMSVIGSVLIAVRSDQRANCCQYPWLAHAIQHNSYTLKSQTIEH